MAQAGTPSFDMSKLTASKRIVGGAAIVYVIWAFFPFWYSCCKWTGIEGTFSAGVSGVNGFRFPMILSWLLAIVALVGVGLVVTSTDVKLPMKHGTMQLVVAGIAALFTLLGLLIKPSEGGFGISISANISWGLIVGIVIAIVWAYGAFMWHSEPEQSAPPPGGGGFGE